MDAIAQTYQSTVAVNAVKQGLKSESVALQLLATSPVPQQSSLPQGVGGKVDLYA